MRWKIALKRLAIAIAFVAAVVAAGALWTRLRSPVAVAEENATMVWEATFKQLYGPVYYVGRDGDFDYFRMGIVFTTYYKARTCFTRLPRVFPVGTDSYRMAYENVIPSIGNGCPSSG